MTAADLLVLFSGVVMVVAFILSWTTIEITSTGYLIEPGTEDLTGLSLMMNKIGDVTDFGGFIPVNLIPITVAVLGIVMIVLGILPKLDLKGAPMALFGLAVAGVALILIAVYIFVGNTSDLFADGNLRDTVKEAIDAGVMKMIPGIGSIIAAIGAILAIFANILNYCDQRY